MQKKQEDTAYRFYVTDCLFALVNGGQTMTKRFYDIIHPAIETPETKQEEKKEEEKVVNRIAGGLRGIAK